MSGLYARVVVITLLLLPILGTAQVTVHGWVISLSDSVELGIVEIYDDLSGQLVLSDQSGQFAIEGLEQGVHTISAFAAGFEIGTWALDLVVDTTVLLQLVPLSVDLTAVEIAARRIELFGLRQLRDVEGTEIYAGKKSEVVMLDLVRGNIAGNNSRQVYAQVVGLNIYEGSDGGIQLGIGGRGLDPNRTTNFNTRQNSYDISADVLGYPENYYTPPAEALEEIQIIRGASSLQYGTQFGGLINFRMRDLASGEDLSVRTNQSVGSNGFFNSFNWFAVRFGDLTATGYYNFKTGDGYRPDSDFDVHNVFASVAYGLSPRTKVKGEFTYYHYLAKQAGGLTDQQFESDPRMSTRVRNWFEVDWQLYNLRLDHEFRSGGNLSASLFALNARRNSVGFRGNPLNPNENPITSIDEQDSEENYIYPRDLIKGKFRNIGAELRYLHDYQLFGVGSVGLVGAKVYRASNTSFQGAGSRGTDANFRDYTKVFPDYPNQSDFEFPNTNFALFGENIIYLGDKFSVTPGIRFEYIDTRSEGTYTQVTYDLAGNPINREEFEESDAFSRAFTLVGVGVAYKNAPEANIYANVSQNYRSVTFSDIRTVNPTFIIDPDISDEKGFTADFGVRGKIDNLLSYDGGVFGVYYDDRIGVVLDDRANRLRTNIGTALIIGFESMVDWNIAKVLQLDGDNLHWNAYLNAAITHSEYLSSEANNVEGKRVEFVPTVNMKSGLNFGYKNIGLSIQWTYISEQFTDAQNSPIAPKGDKRSGIVGEIPEYDVMDVTLSYRYQRFLLETGLNNFFNEAYFTRRATGYPGPGIIPSEGRTFFLTLAYQF